MLDRSHDVESFQCSENQSKVKEFYNIKNYRRITEQLKKYFRYTWIFQERYSLKFSTLDEQDGLTVAMYGTPISITAATDKTGCSTSRETMPTSWRCCHSAGTRHDCVGSDEQQDNLKFAKDVLSFRI